MLLVTLLGCGMGTLTTADGEDRVRAALYFLPDSTLSLELYGARQAYVLLANSTLPCWPADHVQGEIEEEANPIKSQEETYWEAQQATMLSREGALVVGFSLAIGPNEDWLGRYPIQSDAWEPGAMSGYVAADGRVASGAWQRIIESGVEDGTGLTYAIEGVEILEEEHDLGVGAPAWIEVARKDTELAGTFDLSPTELSGDFRAERCDNLELLANFYQVIARLAIEDGALEDGTGDTGAVPPGEE